MSIRLKQLADKAKSLFTQLDSELNYIYIESEAQKGNVIHSYYDVSGFDKSLKIVIQIVDLDKDCLLFFNFGDYFLPVGFNIDPYIIRLGNDISIVQNYLNQFIQNKAI